MSNSSLTYQLNGVNSNGSDPLTDTLPTHTDPVCVVSPWQDVNPPSDYDLKLGYMGQDVGMGEMLESVYKGRVLYDRNIKTWYLWDGHYWKADRCDAIRTAITKQLSKWFSAARFRSRDARIDAKARADQSQDNDAKAKHVVAMQAAAAEEQMYSDASTKYGKLKNIDNAITVFQRSVTVGGDMWDTNNYQVACPNGTLEISAQGVKFRAGLPDDYNRTVTGINWEGMDKTAPLWDRVVCEAMSNDEGKAEYIMSLFGYAILGLSEQHILPCLVGEGRNGKGIIMEAVQKVMGGYAHAASDDLLVIKGKTSQDAASPSIAELQGKRLVWVDETQEGAILDTAQMKRITGGGELRGRMLYSSAVTFDSVSTIFLITNHKPHIKAADYAAWRRVKATEFNIKYVDEPTKENERLIDETLPTRLEGEYSGILASLVHYAHLYLKGGRKLVEPAKVKAATNSYRDGEDTVLEYIETRCTQGDEYRVSCKDLYADYRLWVETNGYGKPMSNRSFAKRVGGHGFARTNSKSYTRYIGIGMLV